MLAVPQDTPQAFHIMAKPTGAICNLDCQYCYYLSREMLYPGSRFRMADALLEAYIRQLLESHRAPEVSISWQGGEPTLMGLAFFKRSVAYAEKHRRAGQRIRHTIQTNGTKLDDEWCTFFGEHDFLVGLSVDGPQTLHDAYRVTKGGAGSFNEVMRGWRMLRRHNVEVNILCTVHAANADHPLDVYRFLRDEMESKFIQFIPIVEKVDANAPTSVGNRRRDESAHLVTGRSVGASQYGAFLIDIFEEWVRRDVGRVYVQIFDVTLGNWLGQQTLCIFSPTCGNALALEHNGDLFACDHFVEPDYLLGNIAETHMIELITSEKQRQFGKNKLDSLPAYCQECEVRFACHGGCPRNRFMDAPPTASVPAGQAGLNYLCAGYRDFFGHVERPMRIMSGLLRQGRPAAEIMSWYASKDAGLGNSFTNTGRNDPCPCGSGKKFKRCHGRPTARGMG